MINSDEISERYSLRFVVRCAMLITLSLVALAGCQRGEGVRTYQVPEERTASRSLEFDRERATHQMLAAVVPVGNQAWFFKLTGTRDEVASVRDDVLSFFESIEVENGEVHWKLPEGWSEVAGSGMRASTLKIDSAEPPLEISVTELPWQGDLLANVNRWRGQLQLPPMGPWGLADNTQALEIPGREATLVELFGILEEPGARPPIASQPPPAAASVPRMAPPDSWEPLPASGFRKAAFRVAAADVEGEAEVTVMDFAAAEGSAMAEPLPNVNRWRGEIGLEPIEADQLETSTKAIEIDGHPATLVELIEGDRPEATLAAMVRVEGNVWFLKLRGDREVVEAQADEFRQFVESIQFGATEGEVDGDD